MFQMTTGSVRSVHCFLQLDPESSSTILSTQEELGLQMMMIV